MNLENWIKSSVRYENDLLKEAWRGYLDDINPMKLATNYPKGELLLGEPPPKGDFIYWLNRAFDRHYAQLADYSSEKDSLIERKIVWKETGDFSDLVLLPITPKGKYRALLLDRDGIINQDSGYVYDKKKVEFVPGIEKVIAYANSIGVKVIVLTNQSGVGRGYYNEEDVIRLHHWMMAELEKRGAKVDGWYYSPFHPESTIPRYKKSSYTRKPLPGMALKAAAEHGISLDRSLMIGDKVSDMLAHIDIHTILYKGNYDLGGYPYVCCGHEETLEEVKKFFS